MIDSDYPLDINISGNKIITFDKTSATFKNNVISNNFQSPNASDVSGFRLYTSVGESILEVDRIIERNATSNNLFLYPELWLNNVNVVSNISDGSNDYNEEKSEDFTLTFIYPHSYKVDDVLRFYKIENSDEESDNDDSDEDVTEETEELLTIKTVDIQVKKVLDDYSISFESNDDSILNISNTLIFSINSGSIRIKDNNIDIIIDDKIHSRYGNISKDEFGIYSENGVFKNAKYSDDYNLPDEDSSTKFASTEWVKK